MNETKSERTARAWAGLVAVTVIAAGAIWGVGATTAHFGVVPFSGVQPALGPRVVITYLCPGSVITEPRGPILLVDCNNGNGSVTYDCGPSSVICASTTIHDSPLSNRTFTNWTSSGDAFFGPSATTSCSTHQFSASNPVAICMNVPVTGLVGTGTVVAHVV